ncbi:MAG: efflux RND transporter periplasmic adaptor subunit [Campylobacterota bacterium]
MKWLRGTILGVIVLFTSLNAIEVTGIVIPKHQLELAFSIDGKVSDIFLKEGDRVKKDQIVLKLDDSLQKLDAKRKKIIYEDGSFLNALKKNEKLISKIVKSNKQLYERTKSISQDEVISSQIKYYEHLAQYLSTKHKKSIENIEHQMSLNLLKNHTLASPINGIITKIEYDVGEWIRSGDSVVEIVDYSECFVEFNIEQKYVTKLEIGNKLPVKVKNGEEYINKNSTIVFISPVADSSSSLVRIKTKLNNSNLAITPGLSAFVSIEYDNMNSNKVEQDLIPLENNIINGQNERNNTK